METLFWLTVAFVYGTLTGSCLNMLFYRLRRRISIWKPSRSFCDSCGKTLRMSDLLPVAGWLLARGSSRCCGKKISPVYPLVELAMGITFSVIAFLVLRGDAC
ncbi:MAG: prepilin peptidase [Firmicutes bacterium]|nr:prepilin peptidase [Bacillota bacterium]